MTSGALASMLLAAGAVAFVLLPLFRKDAAQEERASWLFGEARELHSQREMAITALRDLEDDWATGKIGETDYAELKAKLSGWAIDAMRRLDALEPAQRGTSPHRGKT